MMYHERVAIAGIHWRTDNNTLNQIFTQCCVSNKAQFQNISDSLSINPYGHKLCENITNMIYTMGIMGIADNPRHPQ